jgi:hypothetical protein
MYPDNFTDKTNETLVAVHKAASEAGHARTRADHAATPSGGAGGVQGRDPAAGGRACVRRERIRGGLL